MADRAVRHLPALDGVRGAAIVAVVVHHAFRPVGGGLAGRTLGAIAGAGWVGVVLFFVLSGFLISGVLLDAKGTRGYFENFYMRRFLRIVPLYYGFLAFFFFILPLLTNVFSDHGARWVARPGYWLYLTNLDILMGSGRRPEALDPMWTLAAEEQVYAVWPTLIALLAPRGLRNFMALLVPFALLFRTTCLLTKQSISVTYAYTPSVLDAFAAGTMVAIWLRGAESGRALRRWARTVAGGSGLFLAGMGLGQRHFSFWENPVSVLTVGLSGLAVFFGACIACIATGQLPPGLLRGFLCSEAMRLIGRHSYAIYLIHGLVIQGVERVMMPRFERVWYSLSIQGLFVIVVFGVSYLVAWIVWHAFESRVLSLKRYFPLK